MTGVKVRDVLVASVALVSLLLWLGIVTFGLFVFSQVLT